jgi:hypothetical protein
LEAKLKGDVVQLTMNSATLHCTERTESDNELEAKLKGDVVQLTMNSATPR